jgi:protoporphyrinogen oxidase
MDRTRHLIVGAGISGLAYADRLGLDEDYLICEADREIGGYCKTIQQDGFTWDYSGHFFHFKHPEIEHELISRMKGQKVLKVEKDSRIRWGDGWIDFPFQKNIHQLPREDFLECLVDLRFRDKSARPASFREMLYAKFGKGIAEKFLVPYNEKLYATDLATLDVDAMGRFFPHADEDEILRNFRTPDNASYNSTFTYPEGGAIQYVHAIASGVDAAKLALDERIVAVDLRRKVATTGKREIGFEYLISSAPFVQLLGISGLHYEPSIYTWNKVLVFNLGFDRKGPDGIHWAYFPQRDISFYRVGFYDNIFGSDRMSLYVELGFPRNVAVDEGTIERMRVRVLADLEERAGIVSGHRVVASHSVVMDPAYVHVTQASSRDLASKRRILESRGVYSIGRYGGWTYCSIEDNIVEARALADRLMTERAS